MRFYLTTNLLTLTPFTLWCDVGTTMGGVGLPGVLSGPPLLANPELQAATGGYPLGQGAPPAGYPLGQGAPGGGYPLGQFPRVAPLQPPLPPTHLPPPKKPGEGKRTSHSNFSTKNIWYPFLLLNFPQSWDLVIFLACCLVWVCQFSSYDINEISSLHNWSIQFVKWR
jgi:hypothetical protein